ncbi:MAG: hypothetical protein RLZZ546_737 [Bacteroidota bacterium]|jgi:hypothetical protein
MRKYEKKAVKRIYKLLKNDITQFRFGMPNLFDLDFLNIEFEHKRIYSKKNEITINFEDGIIESPIYIKLKGKYKRKITLLISEYYHEKREGFANRKIEDVENYDNSFVNIANENFEDNNEEDND